MHLAQRFFELYAGLPRAHGKFDITKVAGDKNKMQGRATTVLEPVTVKKWGDHLAGKQGLGIIPIMDDAHCNWGAIDVDEYTNFDIKEFEKKVKALGLPLVTIRTKSGGAHATLYMATPVKARLMRDKLHEFSVALGYPGVEIFPKQTALANEKDVGNWLNMPYFDAERSTRYAIRDGVALSAEEFLDHADAMKVADDATLAALNVSSADSSFSDGPPCLQMLSSNGVPEGCRNNTLFAMGVYARLKYEADWETKVDEFNRQFMSSPIGTKEVTMLVKSLSRKDYFYPCKKEPLCNFCSKEVCRTRKYGIGDGSDEELTISIGHLTMIETKPPTWIIDVDGVRMELETDDLLAQERFRKLCVEVIKKLPNRVKPGVWERMVQDRLQNVEVIQAPADASPEGTLMSLLEIFCTGTSQAVIKDEILAGKPWTDGGRTYFRSQDLFKFLDNQKFYAMTSSRKIYAALRRNDGQHNQMWLKGKNVTCWSVPEFDKQDSDFDVNRVEQDGSF